MARRCPHCQSSSIRYDRSLAGRPVCGGCGRALSPNDLRKAGYSAPLRQALGSSFRNKKNVISWLIPAGLLGGYLFIWANPNAVTTLSDPHSREASKGWNVATPADIELLIAKAQQSPSGAPLQSNDDAIRSIASKLTSKGVRILISDNVMPKAGGEWDASRAELRIRPSTVSMGTATLAEALAHEAAHVAQSCRAGGISKNSEPMGIKVDPAKTYEQQLNSALYKGPLSSKAIELEAFSVGAIPEWAPLLLDHYCR